MQGETFDGVLREMEAVPGFVGERYFHDLIPRLRNAHESELANLFDKLNGRKEVIAMGKCGGKKKGRKGGCKGK